MWLLRSNPIKLAVSAVAVTATLALTGCSDDSSNSSGDHQMSQMSTSAAASATADAAAAFNDADVTFAQTMYPHHAQAIAMAELVPDRTTTRPILELAAAIEPAQAPEMDQIARMLAAWGKPTPRSDMGGGMNHGDAMSGMMSPEQMADLATKTGTDFDTMWLTMMIDHHTGAIAMAQTELAAGRNGQAKQLATDIIAAQEAEIATMNGLLQN